MMTSIPVGGVIWQTMHYLLGLRALGFEVYYVEAHGMLPGMFASTEEPYGTSGAAHFFARTMEHYGFGDRWSYHLGDSKMSTTASESMRSPGSVRKPRR